MTERHPVKILFTAFEAAPFFKSGGLGDVAGSLPRYVNGKAFEVRVILPKLSQIPEKYVKKMEYLENYRVPLGWRHQYCGLFRLRAGGVTYYFLDNEYYFKRDKAYGEFDDGERMAFFSKALLESIAHINALDGFFPDILHCNDWHTALAPVFLREQYMQSPGCEKIKTIFTVHNLKFQGMYDPFVIGDILGLEGTPAESQLTLGNAANYLQGALRYSDRITTVSPSYAQEICTEYYGENMNGLFSERKDVLSGILNGIDYKIFDPQTDKMIPSDFGPKLLKNKKADKLALQKETGLAENPDVPLFALCSRLTEQKGLDLLTYILPHITERNMQLLILGVGEEKYEEAFSWYAAKYKGKIAAAITFNDALSHRLYAGSDVLLMPSRFEPCGLSQMIAMRYGTLPLVRKTGGLRDSVKAYKDSKESATGFAFDNFNAHELLASVDTALDVWSRPREWNRLVQNAMAEDFSWTSSAKEYKKLYKELSGK